MTHMKSVGIRQLQQHASAVIRDVKAGEVVEITERGRVVARLVPPSGGGRLEALIAAGLATRGDGRGLAESMRRHPPVAGPAGGMTLSEALRELRADER
jgi:prevent-host-death family protein